MKKVIVSLLVIILIAVVGVGGWYLWDSLQKEKNKTGELENKILAMEDEKKEVKNKNNDSETEKKDESTNKYEKIVAKHDVANDSDYKNLKGFKSTKLAFDVDKDYYGLVIEKIIKNEDGTYTVRGVTYVPYKLTNAEFEELKNTGYVKINGIKCEKYKPEFDRVETDGEIIDIQECVADKYGNKATYTVQCKDKSVWSDNTQYSDIYRATEKYMEITLDSEVFVYSCGEVDMEDGVGQTIEEFYNEARKNADCSWYNFGFKDGKCVEILPCRFTT